MDEKRHGFVRKDAGKALIRFLIGILVLAILIVLAYTLVFNRNYANNIAADWAQRSYVLDGSTVSGSVSTSTGNDGTSGNNAGGDVSTLVVATAEAVATTEPTPEPTAESTSTPEPTPEITATPAPTAIPQSDFCTEISGFKAKNYKITDFEKGISVVEVSEANERRVVKLEGWCYVNESGYDGETSELALIVQNSDGAYRAYAVNKVLGASGIDHVGEGTNLTASDFRVYLDVSGYPDGDYQIGMAVQYKNAKKRTVSDMYTFGDAYIITVFSGAIVNK